MHKLGRVFAFLQERQLVRLLICVSAHQANFEKGSSLEEKNLLSMENNSDRLISPEVFSFPLVYHIPIYKIPLLTHLYLEDSATYM